VNPKQFLLIGGIILVALGVLGMVGVLGPTQDESVLVDMGLDWWFDDAENWAHLVLGVIALAAAFVVPAGMQRWLVLAVGVLGILVGLYSVLNDTVLWGANLQNPEDTLLHLVVGAWALAASWKKSEAAAPMSPTMPM